MKKRMITHGIAIIGIAVLAFLAIASATLPQPASGGSQASQDSQELTISMPLQNPQNFLLYPAVGVALTNLNGTLAGKTARFNEIHCLDNEFIIMNCVATRSTFDFITYKIKLAYADDQLNVEFVDIESMAKLESEFSDTELMKIPRFNTKEVADQLKADIEQNLLNEDVYNNAKKAFLENNTYLNGAFRPVTSARRDELTATLFDKDEISLSVVISDVKNNNNAEYKSYTTVITAWLYTDAAMRLNAMSPGSANPFASLTLYTSDSSLTRLKPRENVILNGKLVTFEFSKFPSSPDRFTMTK